MVTKAAKLKLRTAFASTGSVERAAMGSLVAAILIQLCLAASGILLARGLGPANRGYFALLVLLPYLLFQIGEIGMPTAVAYFIARDQNSAAGVRAAIVPAAAIQAVLLSCVLVGIVIVYSAHRPSSVVIAGLVAVVIIPSNLAVDYSLAILQGYKRLDLLNAFRIIPAAISCVGVIAAFVASRDNLVAMMCAWCGGMVIAAAVITLWVSRTTPVRVGAYSWSEARRLLAFGGKGLLGSLSPIESFKLDQILVGTTLGAASLGYYVVALAFTNLPRFLAIGLSVVAYPHIAGQRAGSRRRWLWGFVAVTLLFVGGTGFALELSVGFFITLLFGPGFSPAIVLARILIAAGVLFSAKRILADGLRGMGYPGAGTVAEIASWIVVVPALLYALWIDLTATSVAILVLLSGAANVGALLVLERRVASRVARDSDSGNSAPEELLDEMRAETALSLTDPG